ncbi:hypothetical protein [Thiohalophilus sp.]|uniref:hypothetical protein n=1 Tax=Thiohalophilus sp. TaxID=3028392 RepID=UPI002ACE3FCA|nr:hypothetical protein [Thiohalophilus sp.]MDZ7662744.1 hypothetical protein [Thiohalophilus sp.]
MTSNPSILASIWLRAGLIALSVSLTACGGSSGSGDTDSGEVTQSGFTGAAQKGPFRSGGEATATVLNADGSPGGDSASGEIGDSGAYSIDSAAVDWSGPTLLQLAGTYFDETAGNFSSVSRELDAAINITGDDLQANVNLFTHFAAARIRQLMADGETFADAVTQAHDELQTLTGIGADPRELNLLESEAALEEDSANLLLFSAALLTAGLDQTDIDAIAADFADNGLVDGSVDGSGQSAFAQIQQAAENNANLLDDARTALQDMYGGEPPQGDNSGMGWLLDACTAARLNEPRVVCEDEAFYGNDRDDSGEFVTFIPREAGHYTVELFGDPNATDANVGQCSWVVYKDADTSSTEMGDSYHSNGWCGVEDVTTFRLGGGREYYIRPLVSQDDDTGPDARFKLSVIRVAEGKALASSAVAIPVGDTYDAVVGKLINTSDESYYRFEVGQGDYTIGAGGYPCGDGELRLDLYEDAFSTKIEKAWEADVCYQSMDVSIEAGTYYLKVENRLGGFNRDTFRPSPGGIGFELSVSP